MDDKSKNGHRLSLLAAIAAASIASSVIVFSISFLAARPLLADYVRNVVRGHHATIVSFFTESISQQVLVGDGPEILRKCNTLLREDYVRAVYIKDLGGEVVCDLRKPDDGYALRWNKSPIYFDEAGQNLATNVWLAFSTETEQRLIWVTLIAAIAGAVLLLVIQLLLTIPLSRRILKPLADISSAVGVKNPEDITLPDFRNYRPLVVEVRAIFQSMQGFLERFKLYRSQLIESTRYEAVARTVQIIAHDLKAPMASFERITRIPESQFAQEKKHLIQALHQLYSMTDAIKRAEFEDVVRLSADRINLEPMLRNCQSVADKLGKSLIIHGPLTLENVPSDPTKLFRAASNLIINALEACEASVDVHIELTSDALNIAVADDGPGVSCELEERLFTRGATQGKSQGTGLGLHYARRVAQGHGGDVSYKRTNGLTLFVLSIPRALSVESELESLDFSAVQELKEGCGPRDKDVLIVVKDFAKSEALRGQVASEADIVLSMDVNQVLENSYRIVLCEDWDVASQLKARQQKILIDPADSVEKVLVVLGRLQKPN